MIMCVLSEIHKTYSDGVKLNLIIGTILQITGRRPIRNNDMFI